jgi:hypothetical protein
MADQLRVVRVLEYMGEASAIRDNLARRYVGTFRALPRYSIRELASTEIVEHIKSELPIRWRTYWVRPPNFLSWHVGTLSPTGVWSVLIDGTARCWHSTDDLEVGDEIKVKGQD